MLRFRGVEGPVAKVGDQLSLEWMVPVAYPPRRLMHLIEILLPLADNAGKPFPDALQAKVRDELVEHFGGVTAFTRSPAEGLWKEGGGKPDRDDIVILEVMADWLDRGWWRVYRAGLEQRFGQDEIVVRAREVELL